MQLGYVPTFSFPLTEIINDRPLYCSLSGLLATYRPVKIHQVTLNEVKVITDKIEDIQQTKKLGRDVSGIIALSGMGQSNTSTHCKLSKG